jgi:hypothetical protein
MKRSVVVIAFALVSAVRTVVHACPDAEYEERLKALRALTSAVAAEQPEPTALASFFKALPPDFSCFNRIFGYSDGPAPLYSEPQLYPLFPKIAAIVPKSDYARKLVALAVNARWEADQTGALQDATRAVLDSHTQLFVKLLGELSAESERSVWAFLFGAPHPSNEPLSPAVQSEICEASTRSCDVSKQVYARAVSEEHNH